MENLCYEEVSYWKELCNIFAWAEHHVYSTLFICWGAMAGLYYHYGIPKHLTKRKVSGVYRHCLEDFRFPLTQGFDDCFCAIHSRHAEVRREDLENNPKASQDLCLLSASPEGGLYLLQNRNGRKVFVIGHAEYDLETLKQEYLRDQNRDLNPDVPFNYFPENDIEQIPNMSWRAHATLLFGNWINHYVYQKTPYHLEEIH